MKKIIIIMVLTLIGMSVFGVGNSQSATAPDRAGSKVINVGITNDPATVSPLSTNNVMAHYASSILFMTLVAETPERTFVNCLAESITTADNRTFIVKINRNVKWTDGTPVTAADVIFTMNVFSNPVVGVRDTSAHRIVVGSDDSGCFPRGAASLSGVKQIDDYTMSVETKYPITLNIFKLEIGTTLRTMPKHILEKEALANILQCAFFQRPTVTNGPFRFREYVAGQYLSLTANDAYFMGRPKIDTLNFKVLSGNQITSQLESGEIDMNYQGVGLIPADDYERVLAMAHIKTERSEPGTVQTLFYKSATFSLKARQAMDMAINRDGILNNIFKGGAFMTRTPVSSRVEYWNEEAARYTYDPERAKALLAESGLDTSKKFVFAVPTGNATRERVCVIIAENFKAIGLNVVIERADMPTTMARIQQRDYDISILGMPANVFNLSRNLRYYADSRDDYTGYDDPAMDALLKTIYESVDDKTLRAAYYEAQARIAQDVPVSGVYSELALRAVNKRVSFGGLSRFGTLHELEKWDVGAAQ
jgi:peptide/nickel transport system substrate-binding protein